jgi:hypothetical protein
MAHSKTKTTQHDPKNVHKAVPAVLPEQSAPFSGIDDLSEGWIGTHRSENQALQAQFLSATRFPIIQRQAIAKQIAHVQGNQYLEQVFASLQREESVKNVSTHRENETPPTHPEQSGSVQTARDHWLTSSFVTSDTLVSNHPVLYRQPQDSFEPGWEKQQGETISPDSPNFDPQEKMGKIHRFALYGLSKGNQSADLKPLPDSKKLKNTGFTLKKTSESATGRAIVLVPDWVSESKQPSSNGKPIDVLVHLHGHGVGYRLEQGQKKTRDVAIDRTEQQLEASGLDMIAVLPQGTRYSGFGSDFDSDSYLNEVFEKLKKQKRIPDTSTLGRVVFSAHSGGGNTIIRMQKDPSRLPSSMKELVLFDAINDPSQVATLMKILDVRLKADLANIRAQPKGQEKKWIERFGFRFRGYHTPKYQKKDTQGNLMWKDPETQTQPVMAGYGVAYEKLNQEIKRWFDLNTKGLPSDIRKAFADNYQVLKVSSQHDALPGAILDKSKTGVLHEALSALP